MRNMCFDVVFMYENIITCLFTRFRVFSPFSAHFYPHYAGKGSIDVLSRPVHLTLIQCTLMQSLYILTLCKNLAYS